MGLFNRNRPPKRTVFLIKHDKWLERWDAEFSQSGYFVYMSTGNSVMLLPGGNVVGTSSVQGWLPLDGWPEETVKDDRFQKLKDELANERDKV